MDRAQLPLNALRAFEAAARHLNFTRAAIELHVSQGAVSHQVAQLERRLGTRLFLRLPRGLALTDEGQALLPVLSEAFERMSATLASLQTRQRREVLSIGVVGTFAVGWLLPRLRDFQARHPLIELRLFTHNNRVDLADEGLDAAIRFGDGHWPGCEAVPLMATPLADSDGNHLGFDAMLLDLSRWSDRTALVPATHDETLVRRLASADHSLGMLRRELEGFSQVLGHDMRSPIRHVLAFLRLARERLEALQQTDAALNEYCNGVQKAAHRLYAMIEAMHDYLLLCRARLNIMDVPMGPLVQSVLAHLASSRTGQPIDWQVAGDLPTVRGDPMLLAQAIRHLLDNAVKFTRPVASPRIALHWTRANDGRFHFHIDDNGVGFDRQHADKLFLLFQRQHHSSDFDGLGAGLAMTHRIIERHGGELFCDATPDGGCRVRFTLPDGRLDEPGIDID